MSVLGRLAKAVGWTPVGKPVQMHIDEASEPGLAGASLSGRIVSLDSEGVATLSLDHPIRSGGQAIDSVLAHPRHEGYGFFRIGFGGIAVDLSPTDGAAHADRRFALAIVKLDR